MKESSAGTHSSSASTENFPDFMTLEFHHSAHISRLLVHILRQMKLAKAILRKKN